MPPAVPCRAPAPPLRVPPLPPRLASLVFDAHIKTSLLEYASTAMLFADKHVDSTIISWNRCVRVGPARG
jgi:hypothetical protein